MRVALKKTDNSVTFDSIGFGETFVRASEYHTLKRGFKDSVLMKVRKFYEGDEGNAVAPFGGQMHNVGPLESVIKVDAECIVSYSISSTSIATLG